MRFLIINTALLFAIISPLAGQTAAAGSARLEIPEILFVELADDHGVPSVRPGTAGDSTGVVLHVTANRDWKVSVTCHPSVATDADSAAVRWKVATRAAGPLRSTRQAYTPADGSPRLAARGASGWRIPLEFRFRWDADVQPERRALPRITYTVTPN